MPMISAHLLIYLYLYKESTQGFDSRMKSSSTRNGINIKLCLQFCFVDFNQDKNCRSQSTSTHMEVSSALVSRENCKAYFPGLLSKP